MKILLVVLTVLFSMNALAEFPVPSKLLSDQYNETFKYCSIYSGYSVQYTNLRDRGYSKGEVKGFIMNQHNGAVHATKFNIVDTVYLFSKMDSDKIGDILFNRCMRKHVVKRGN